MRKYQPGDEGKLTADQGLDYSERGRHRYNNYGTKWDKPGDYKKYCDGWDRIFGKGKKNKAGY